MGTEKGLQSGSVNGGGLKPSCGESVDRFVLPERFFTFVVFSKLAASWTGCRIGFHPAFALSMYLEQI